MIALTFLNGRFPKVGLSKTAWLETKKAKLEKNLYVLDLTERISKDPNRGKDKLPNSLFMSDSTLVAWRLVFTALLV